jgi:hypothetical protein
MVAPTAPGSLIYPLQLGLTMKLERLIDVQSVHFGAR